MRQPANLLVTALLAATMVVLFDAAPATAHDGMGGDALPPDVRGTYRLPNGEVLTFSGATGMPSYELGDQRVFMRRAGDERWSAWREDGHVLAVERDSGGAVIGVRLERPLEAAVAARKVRLYDEFDVSFANGNVVLAGSLVLPTGSGPHPAVVIVHGAEAAARDSYLLLASHFARRGVAALIYDKRGVGQSGGGSFRQAAFDDLTGDALAGLALLQSLPAIDASRVGMVGLSQGGWVIAMAAAQSDDVAFVIPISASGFSPAVQDRWLNGNIVAHRALNRGVNQASERAWRMLLSSRELVDAGLLAPMPDVPGFWFHALDPNLDAAPLWSAVRQPLLAVWGEFDCQVPAHDSLAAVKAALDGAGHTSYSLLILPRADHSITLVGPCAQETSGWNVLRFDYPAGYFALLADWVRDHPGQPAMRRVSVPDDPALSNLAWHQPPTAGVGLPGSFVPQLTLMLVMPLGFALAALAWPVSRTVARLRRRPARSSFAGPLALVGLLAMLASIVSLVELLLLGSPDGAPLVGSGTILGATPLYVAASVLALTTIVAAVLAGLRRLTAGGGARRLTAGEAAVLALVAMFTAWATYWNFVPAWGLLG